MFIYKNNDIFILETVAALFDNIEIFVFAIWIYATLCIVF